MDPKIKLFECCRVVKGYTQSIICDLQRFNYTTIPNDLADVMDVIDSGMTRNEVKLFYNNQYNEVIDEYIDFLISEEFAFYTNNPELYPKMSLLWDSPFPLTNAILEISNQYDYIDVIRQLNQLKCKNIEFRWYNSLFDASVLNEIVSLIERENMIVTNLVFLFPFEDGLEKTIEDLLLKTSRVVTCIVHSSMKKDTIQNVHNKKNVIFYSLSNIGSSNACGCIEKGDFLVNIDFFTESLHNNTCLNRKIAVDKEGYIRNCLSMLENFGNVHEISLANVLVTSEFKKLWNITKDQIAICNVCEFRHICMDCRAFVEDPNNILSKPLKCGYNPYSGEWIEWSTNPLKIKAIDYYKHI